MVQTCQNINVHVVNTDTYMNSPIVDIRVLMDIMRKHTYQCAHYKLKNCYKI